MKIPVYSIRTVTRTVSLTDFSTSAEYNATTTATTMIGPARASTPKHHLQLQLRECHLYLSQKEFISRKFNEIHFYSCRQYTSRTVLSWCRRNDWVENEWIWWQPGAADTDVILDKSWSWIFVDKSKNSDAFTYVDSNKIFTSKAVWFRRIPWFPGYRTVLAAHILIESELGDTHQALPNDHLDWMSLNRSVLGSIDLSHGDNPWSWVAWTTQGQAE